MTEAVCLDAMRGTDRRAHQPMESVDRLVLIAVVLALLVFPFINILHFALPIRDVAGKSGWLVGVTTILILAYLVAARPWSNKELRQQRYVIAAAVLVCGALVLRSLAYGESIVPINFRFIVLAIVSISISAALIRRGALGVLTVVLSAQGILVALLVYSNMNYFPHILIASDDSGLTGIVFNGERTRSMLINASIGSNAIVASMLVIVAWAKSRSARFDSLARHLPLWATLLFMSYCVTLTGTRYPTFASGLVLLLGFWLLPKRLSLIAIAIAIPLLMGISVLIDSTLAFVAQLDLGPLLRWFGIVGAAVPGAPHDLGWIPSSDALPNLRVDQDSGGRLEKLMLALGMITNGPVNMLIGASLAEIGTTKSANLMVFSDNSFGTILLEAGLPAGLFLIVAGASYLGRYSRTLVGACFAAYFAGALCFTNAILWDSWFSSVFFVFPVIYALGGPPFRTPRIREHAGASSVVSGA